MTLDTERGCCDTVSEHAVESDGFKTAHLELKYSAIFCCKGGGNPRSYM